MSKVAEKMQADQEVLEMAQEVIRLEAVLKEMKDTLKKHVEVYGDLSIGGGVFSYTPTISWEFKPEVLKEMFVAIACDGHNPYEYATFSTSELKKLGWMEQALIDIGADRKESKRFGFKKGN